MANASTDSVLRERTLNGWLWKFCFAMAMLVVTVAAMNCFLPSERAITRGMFGHDSLAFYSAGKLVDEGRADELYDLAALARTQQSIAEKADIELDAPLAPWWNPPHIALLFSPMAKLSFGAALTLWTILGAMCLGITGLIFAMLFRDESNQKRHWLLAPMALLVAPPTLQALGHGQNTPLSLLLLTLTVLAWRAREPIWAGLCCSLLCYKPQLAAVVFVALSLTLGWRVWMGTIVGAVPQLLLIVTKMPGSISDYLEQMPRNLQQIQFAQPYLWHRHSTLTGFFRFMLQGNAPGQTHVWITFLAASCAILVGLAVLAVWWKRRAVLNDDVMFDRFIALTILAMPLLMPFYFDYDLLLLIVAAVLIGRERLVSPDHSSAARWLVATGTFLFVWTMFNPPVAESFGICLTVPLLCIVVALQARRCLTDSSNEFAMTLPMPVGQRLAA